MFPTKARYSAIGVSYNPAVTAFGGRAPFIATFLVSHIGSDNAPALYIIVAAVISTLVLLTRVRET